MTDRERAMTGSGSTPIYELRWEIRHPDSPFTTLKMVSHSSGDVEWVISRAEAIIEELRAAARSER
jgi:hypothetical protein